MKKLFILLAFATSVLAAAQSVAINTDGSAANATAILDLTSTSKGFLPPRMTQTERNTIINPATGLMVWCTNCGTSGEMQVYNGTTWINMVGGASTGRVPGAPTNVVASAGVAQASVTFTAPANVGSTITGYTVTSSPGSFTAYGSSSPIVFTNLDGGVSYTFTVVATNAAGNSSSSSASAAFTANCGAFVASGVFKIFMCHNLGATTSLDPNVPVQAIHGNYYQWGRIGVVANASTPSGAISGWITTSALNGAWLESSKTATDPCPAGYRVPAYTQWYYISTSPTVNFVSRTGSWVDSYTNFGSAIHFGATAGTKALTLPAAGSRLNTDGSMTVYAGVNRGSRGDYWSCTETSTYAYGLYFNSSSASTSNFYRPNGHSVRCVSE